jgi:hypothetical protein
MDIEDKQRLFITAMSACMGNVTKACELCCIARQTYYNWMNAEDSDFADQIAEIQFDAVERRIDLAEQKLDERVDLGSGPDIRFVLKTLGAKRGYGKKSEVTLNPGAGFQDLAWPDETPNLDVWEGKRDDTLKEAEEARIARGEVLDGEAGS